jgi:CRP/FNR family cyclic AMP-dependent transcriptional regulator
MIGASRETVSRTMKEFQDAGWIGVIRRRVTITNRGALEKRAQARV